MSRLQMEDLSSFPSTASTSQEDHENKSGFTSFRKLRVTLLSIEWSSTKGGLSTINRELAIQLAKRPSVEVSVYLPQCSEEDKRVAASDNVRLIKAAEIPALEPNLWLSCLPENHTVDCVIGHGAVLGHQVQLIKRHHKCKWIQIVHTAPEELGIYKSDTDAISRGEKKHNAEVKLCEKADQVVAVGPKLAEAFSGYLRFCGKDQDVLNLTPGVFSEFAGVKQATEERKTFCVLVFGRGDNEDFQLKGYDIAASAIAELKDEPRPYKLLFVGAPSGEEEKVKEFLLQKGIDRSQLIVRCLSESREQLARLFCEVDLALMPSRSEGFGLAALEALSAGLPVLVSGNSGLGEALKEVPYGSSCVVESEDPKVWANAIKAVRQKDRKMRLKESEALRLFYKLEYSWEKECGKLVEKMSNITLGGGRTFDALRQIERETKQWTTKLQSNLETIAHEKGFTISENEGGGNCMFIALSEQLGQAKGIKISHKELRQRVVQYLRENPEMRDGEELFHFVHGYPSWDAYLTSMMADGTWGDHVILHGAANCFEMCVHVISSLGHDSDVMICEEFDVTGSKRLVLGHVAELHFVSLFPHKGARDWYLASPLEIFIKVSCQETIALEVDSNDFIGNLKNKIKDKKGFPVETQRISYRGEVLNDDRTVGDYNIQNQSTLNLIRQGVEIDYRVDFVTESPSTQDIMNRVADWYLQTVKPSNRDELNEFVDYMENFRNVIVVGVKTGSLIFTLSCGSVQILDKLWEDYKTGRLNKIAQSYLVTNDVLKEFGLSSLKLTSNIKEEDYRACRLRLATIKVTNQTLRSLRAAFFRWITIRGHTKTMLESLVRDLLGEYDTATGNTVGFVMGAGAVAVLAAPFTFGASLVAAAAVGGIGAAIGGQVEKTFRLPMVQRAIDRDRTACRELQQKLISLDRTFTSTASAGALIRNVSRFANASVLPLDISQLVESSLDRHNGSTSPIVQEIRRILNNLKCPDEKEIQRLVRESLID